MYQGVEIAFQKVCKLANVELCGGEPDTGRLCH